MIILFLISLLAIFLLLNYQAWLIHTKQVENTHTEIVTMNRKMFKKFLRVSVVKTKNSIHNFFLGITKYRILTGNAIKHFMEDKFPKVYAIFSTKHAVQMAQEVESKTTSFFFRSIAEYKYKIKKLKEHMHKDEERKEEQREIEKEEKLEEESIK